jgi:hypothetical protein
MDIFTYETFVMYGRRGDNPNAKNWEVRSFPGSIVRQELGTVVAQNLTEEEADELVARLIDELNKQSQ